MRRLLCALLALLLLSACGAETVTDSDGLPDNDIMPDAADNGTVSDDISETAEPDDTSDTGENGTSAPVEGITVVTDWSKLGERGKAETEEKVGSRWYEDYTDDLICRDDYGLLYPYAGQRLMDDWPAADGCIYGLMTADGVAVTDPVFNGAGHASYYDGGKLCVLPLLVLCKGVQDENGWASGLYAIAAADGSWCTGFKYSAYSVSKDGLLLFEDGSLSLMSPTGKILGTYTPEEIGITEEEFDEMISAVNWGEGWGGRWSGDYITIDLADYSIANPDIKLFQISSGQTVAMPLEEWDSYYYAEEEKEWTADIQNGEYVISIGGETYTIQYDEVDFVTDIYGELVFFSKGAVYNLDGTEILTADETLRVEFIQDSWFGEEAPGLIAVSDGEYYYSTASYYLTDGTPVEFLSDLEWKWYRQVSVIGGLIQFVDLNTASYYDINTLECVFRTNLWYQVD